MVLENKKYVVGIDIGAVSSGLSIAHVNRPHSKFTVNTWKDKYIRSEPKQFPTSILYKANGDMHCGLSSTANDKGRIDEGDIYIGNIKQYTLNIDRANEELGQKMEGLTIQKVVTDYLKTFHALAIECLKKQEDFCNSYNFEQDFKLENLGYCLSCPTSLNDFFADCFVEAGITEKDTLIFVSESESTAFHYLSLDRLTTNIVPDQTYFVYDIGYSSLGVSKIKANSTESFSEVQLISEKLGQGSMILENSFRNYLIKNMSELNLNESIINSSVETFAEEIKGNNFKYISDPEDFDSEDFDQDDFDQDDFDQDDFDQDDFDQDDFDQDDFDQDDFDQDDFDQEHDKSDKELQFILQENLDSYVDNYEVGQKQEKRVSPIFNLTDINGDPIKITDSDLEIHVFSPYINSLVNYIMNIYHDNNSNSCIFVSGKYSSDANFLDKLSAQMDWDFSKIVSLNKDTNIDAVSLGAVSFGLKLNNMQIPFFYGANCESAILEAQLMSGKKSKYEEEYEKRKMFDFIVGIDFGTTFTGCSYAALNDCHYDDLKAIHTIETGWPGGDSFSFGKTPTLLMYDKNMNTKLWGQEAKQNIHLYEDLRLLSNFKLFLSPEAIQTQYGPGNVDIKKMKEKYDYVCKSVDAVQVISDYLKEVKEHVVRHIVAETKFKKAKKVFHMFSKPFENEPKIQFVLTVPAFWTISARDTMVQAAIKATIIKKEELDDLLIINEPEAAAFFCEKKYPYLYRCPGNPEDDSNFIVCDAGGGTVGLTTFRLTRNKETGEPIICQNGVSIGDTCGSTYLDRAFKNYLLQFYKDIGLLVEDTATSFDSVMDDFNSNIKYTFNPDPNGDGFYIVKLPTEHIINMIPNTPQAKRYTLIEKNTKLEIKHADIKAFFFDPIITNILALIQMQLDQALRTASFINTIFLLGGFSRNPYLQQRVYDEYKGRYSVVIPEDGVTAVSKGAVSYGLNPRLISIKSSGHSVALEVRAPFSKYEDGRFNKKENFENRLEYFVHQSDDLQDESLRTVIVDYPNTAVIAVFACDFKEEDDGKNWRYVSRRHIKVLEEIIKLPEVEEINKGDPIQFIVGLNTYGIGVTITIECQNIHINRKIKEMTNGNVTSLKVVRKCDLVVLKNEKALIEYS